MRTWELLESSFVDVADGACVALPGDGPGFEPTFGHPTVEHSDRDAGDLWASLDRSRSAVLLGGEVSGENEVMKSIYK